MSRAAFCFGFTAFVSGCATPAPPGAELVGRLVQVELADGRVEILRFSGDGTVVAAEGGEQSAGRWGIDADRLCFVWRREPMECWSYERLRRGVTVPSQSDRGNSAAITLLGPAEPN